MSNEEILFLAIAGVCILIAGGYSFYFLYRMEGRGEYSLPEALGSKYVGEMKDGM